MIFIRKVNIQSTTFSQLRATGKNDTKTIQPSEIIIYTISVHEWQLWVCTFKTQKKTTEQNDRFLFYTQL